jgi:uncharacterized protein (DUF2164 family)
MKRKIQINEEKKEEMCKKIINYFDQERDEELGYLGAQMILDFFIDEFGYYFYNQGVEDSYTYLMDKLEDVLSLQVIRR